MGHFQGGRGGNGRPPFNKNRHGGGDRDRERPTMHSAICSECGKTCEVPFRPTGEKPVYCRECFASKRDDSNPRAPRDGGFGFDRPKRDFGDRPSFRPENRPSAPAGGDEDTKRQLVEVTRKLDRLITVVEKLVEAKSATSMIIPEVKKAPVEIKETKKESKKAVVKAPAKKKSTVKPTKKGK